MVQNYLYSIVIPQSLHSMALSMVFVLVFHPRDEPIKGHSIANGGVGMERSTHSESANIANDS